MVIKIKHRLTFTILSLLAFTLSTTLGLTPQQEVEVLRKLPPSGYDKRNRPPVPNSHLLSDPTPILTRLLITSIDNIDDTKMELTILATLHLKWNDKRLNFSLPGAEHVTLVNTDVFWKPDYHFYNARILEQTNEFIRISGNGDVLYSSKVHVTLNCPLSLRYFPMDKPICPIRIISQIYSNDDVKLEWNRLDDKEPVEAVTPSKIFQLFTLTEIDANEYDALNTATESSEEYHTCLQAHLKFRRSFSHYLVHIFIPCTMLVIVSWWSFWLDVEAVTGRCLIGLSSLLVMANQISSWNNKFPPTPYTKAFDVWTGISITFPFVAFLEFIVAYYLAKDEEKGALRSESRFILSGSNLGVEIPLSTVSADSNVNENNGDEQPPRGSETKEDGKFKRIMKKYLSQFKTKSQKLDGISRVVYPLAFLLFVIIYFTYYLTVSGKEQPYNIECA